MVTIRNDIESNGNANRSTDGSPSGAVEGTKNVNHLANGSRRSTVGDMKPKAFNRKCVGFLALIVCVGVCFGVGMLFLYGHLMERLNETNSQGLLAHDKNGNPVHYTTGLAVTTTAAVTVVSELVTSTTTTTGSPPLPTDSTTDNGSVQVHATHPEDEFDLDSDRSGGAAEKATQSGKPTDKDGEQRYNAGSEYGPESPSSSSGSGDYADDEPGDYAEPNREGSGGRAHKM